MLSWYLSIREKIARWELSHELSGLLKKNQLPVTWVWTYELYVSYSCFFLLYNYTWKVFLSLEIQSLKWETWLLCPCLAYSRKPDRAQWGKEERIDSQMTEKKLGLGALPSLMEKLQHPGISMCLLFTNKQRGRIITDRWTRRQGYNTEAGFTNLDRNSLCWEAVFKLWTWG